jgi:hypothetical protein
MEGMGETQLEINYEQTCNSWSAIIWLYLWSGKRFAMFIKEDALGPQRFGDEAVTGNLT